MAHAHSYKIDVELMVENPGKSNGKNNANGKVRWVFPRPDGECRGDSVIDSGRGRCKVLLAHPVTRELNDTEAVW